jgi:hypothetical protein
MSTTALRTLVPAALFGAALAFSFPVSAQMYKWVDDAGVVTYSNTPPPSTSKKKVEALEDQRVSVYTPDAEINRAMSEEGRKEFEKGRLGRRLEEERSSARRTAATPPQSAADRRAAAYERCKLEQRVDCDTARTGEPAYGYTGYYPQHVIGGVVSPPRPFQYLSVPDNRVGINNAPPVGINTTPPVGISTAPPVGVNTTPRVGVDDRRRLSRP